MHAISQRTKTIAAQLAVLLTLSVAMLAMSPTDASAHDGPRGHRHHQRATTARVVRPALPRIVIQPARLLHQLLPGVVVTSPGRHVHRGRRVHHSRRRTVTRTTTTTRHGRRVTTR